MIIVSGYPDATPGYMGPRDLLERYRAGEVVTRTDALLDQSEFVIVPESQFGGRDLNRLKWMTENLERVDGRVERYVKAK